VPGAVGYFSYDMKSFIEDLPDEAKDDLSIPDCILGFYSEAVIYDNLRREAYVAGYDLPDADPAAARLRLRDLKARLGAPASGAMPEFKRRAHRLKSNFSRAAYIRAVEKAKGYIKRGDIYQVNLSQRFECELDTGALELYARLRTVSPAPFAAYLDFGDVSILSSSPERFIAKSGDRIETRPIKGTRPRGDDESSDSALAGELEASAKDRAEHVMIVDLERNDLGRICEYGSVKVAESYTIEKYANVFHAVSTVEGKLKKGVGPVECLRAAFPGGSITGAPKIRSMEIIDELENVRRSVYTGSLGYITFDGDMDTSIVIRTFILKGPKAYFQVGGGIVADSDPGEEYEETLHKARGLMDALGVRVQRSEVVTV
jgi:para-aminobenzoate synthetase component 1